VILGRPQTAAWLGPAQVPELHAAGLRGLGQVVGLGDTGVHAGSCAFADAQSDQVPYNHVGAEHDKIAAYYTQHGDDADSALGHGTHIAGAMVGKAPQLGLGGNGVAPDARLVVVDVEASSRPGDYNVPANDISGSYFSLMRSAGAATACSPWSYTSHDTIELLVDQFAYENQDFLPVFPSGNVWGSASPDPMRPCGAKNVLCVGASYNARSTYTEQPSFAHMALHIGSTGCSHGGTCGQEVPAIPALFGPTTPPQLTDCRRATGQCLESGAACPECAFDASALAKVASGSVAAAVPSNACETLIGFPNGAVCLVYRGTCDFWDKAQKCQQAGAIGVIVVNSADGGDVVMDFSGDAARGLTMPIPVVLVPHSYAAALSAFGARVTFPVLSRLATPASRAPYSAFGTVAGRMRPDVVLPGDNIASVASTQTCATQTMSGTSQSCGFGAGLVALVREYTMVHADVGTARLAGAPWASSLKALVVAAAYAGDGTRPSVGQVGFGLPALGAFLSMPGGADLRGRLHVLQSGLEQGRLEQRLCFSVDANWSSSAAAMTPQVVLAWTDPPAANGRLVHDLDLSVACGTASWQKRLGNHGSSPDTANNVEKVLLRDFLSAVPAPSNCEVSVKTSGLYAASSQAFSLVVAGPFRALPGCEAPTQRPSCSAHGTSSLQLGAWTCACEPTWVGPFCDQKTGTLAFDEASEGRIYPLQWEFRSVQACGGGRYEFTVTSGQAGAVEVSASASQGPHLWASSAVRAAGAWDEDGISFRVSTAGPVRLITIDVPEANATDLTLHLAFFSRHREGALPFTVLLRSAPSCYKSALRGAQGSESGAVLPIVLGTVLGVACLASIAAAVTLLRRHWWFSERHLKQTYPQPSPSHRVTVVRGPVAAASKGQPRAADARQGWRATAG